MPKAKNFEFKVNLKSVLSNERQRYVKNKNQRAVIEAYSGEFNRTELWKHLPKKVMWQTFLVILDYLQEINKIAVDREGKIGYIWNPNLAKRLRQRSEIKV